MLIQYQLIMHAEKHITIHRKDNTQGINVERIAPKSDKLHKIANLSVTERYPSTQQKQNSEQTVKTVAGSKAIDARLNQANIIKHDDADYDEARSIDIGKMTVTAGLHGNAGKSQAWHHSADIGQASKNHQLDDNSNKSSNSSKVHPEVNNHISGLAKCKEVDAKNNIALANQIKKDKTGIVIDRPAKVANMKHDDVKTHKVIESKKSQENQAFDTRKVEVKMAKK